MSSLAGPSDISLRMNKSVRAIEFAANAEEPLAPAFSLSFELIWTWYEGNRYFFFHLKSLKNDFLFLSVAKTMMEYPQCVIKHVKCSGSKILVETLSSVSYCLTVD